MPEHKTSEELSEFILSKFPDDSQFILLVESKKSRRTHVFSFSNGDKEPLSRKENRCQFLWEILRGDSEGINADDFPSQWSEVRKKLKQLF